MHTNRMPALGSQRLSHACLFSLQSAAQPCTLSTLLDARHPSIVFTRHAICCGLASNMPRDRAAAVKSTLWTWPLALSSCCVSAEAGSVGLSFRGSSQCVANGQGESAENSVTRRFWNVGGCVQVPDIVEWRVTSRLTRSPEVGPSLDTLGVFRA